MFYYNIMRNMRYFGRLEILDRRITLVIEDGALVRVILGEPVYLSLPEASSEVLKPFAKEFRAYLEGRKAYPDCPFVLKVSPFAERCLWVLREIPRGEVRTYGWLAQRVGRPKAARAVGRILARNPLPLLFPCHRIVGKKTLGGFSAGLDWKRFLLELEGQNLTPASCF